MQDVHNRSIMLVFVHDFTTDDKSWDVLLDSISTDEEFNSKNINHYIYNYVSDWKGERPSVYTLTQNFKKWIEKNEIYPSKSLKLVNHESPVSVFFIGHGLGGILIMDMIKSYLEENNKGVNDTFLRSIREVILLGSPLEPFDELQQLEKLVPYKKSIFSTSFSNYALKLNQEIEDVLDFIDKNVINVSEFKYHEIPIPFVVFHGKDDSLQYEIPNWFPEKVVNKIPGDHKNMIKNLISFEYTTFKELIFNPIGHKNVFEVDQMIYMLKIEPQINKTSTITYGDNVRVIESENKGVSSRCIMFSNNNICRSLCKLRYGTMVIDGGIQPHIYPPFSNETSQEKIDLYLKDGKEFTFEFTPKNHTYYALDVEVYKGFDGKDAQNAHLHLGNGHYFYRKVIIKLDLSSFINEHFYFETIPVAYILDEDNHSCADTPQYRVPQNILQPTRADKELGIWEWELYNIRSGVVDKVWNIEKTDYAMIHSSLTEIQNANMYKIKKNDFTKYRTLAEYLIKCHTIRDNNSKNAFIKELDDRILMKISLNQPNEILLPSLVIESVNLGLLNDFMEKLQAFEDDSLQLQEVKNYIKSFDLG